MPPRQRRIAMMGYRSVGKTSLVLRFVTSKFDDTYDPTIENTYTKNVTVSGQVYQLEVIDTAGQDEYSVTPNDYYMNVDGYILVYSITSQRSLDIIKLIYNKISDMKGRIWVPIVLVGNKTDLEEDRAVTMEDGKKLADEWEIPFLEVSAKTDEVTTKDIKGSRSVEEVFAQLIKAIQRKESVKDTSCVVS
ncbi:GTP-binding protein Rheb homolog [Octopus sinensis]|uniref:GTP-binding protein Rheb homolog n=1 Tax=Octopus sinensis TaxID=2607531 RepID=A0A6P7T974_9MOLL|nr:GTP-binding protein Rheb homolog [Octopus sinensis]XP_036366465.1 GTP-binding protein Rheb homolog [Octopus sinensis]